MAMQDCKGEADVICAAICRVLQEAGDAGVLLLTLYDEVGRTIPPATALNRHGPGTPRTPGPLEHRVAMGRRAVIDEHLEHLAKRVRVVRQPSHFSPGS